ncbi:acyl-ACP--UDP-N-acetylglucosamine O-acyltransferase [soil metagenome]
MQPEIHPTAIIDPTAKIGDGVRIGPYCVIHAGVNLGHGCWLQNHVTLAGPSTIGPDNRFYAYAAVGQQSQDLKYEGEPTYLEIGQGNTFREFVTVNRGTSQGGKTVIGNHGNFLAYAHVAHDCTVGDHVIFSNNGTLAGHVSVGDHAILGGLTAVHQFCRIGAHSITGGCSKIVQDVPPFMVADGNPAVIRSVNAVGLQRRGFSEDSVRCVKQAYRTLFKRDLNFTQALDALRAHPSSADPAVSQLIAFVASSERGIVR